MSDPKETIKCAVDGAAEATFLCSHLIKGNKLGFNLGLDPDHEDGLYPDAWCDECEEMLDAEGEWNDEATTFADIKVVCAQC